VTRTLGIREDPGRTPADILVDWLQPRRALLVLDNCEHLVAECAELIDVVLEQCEGVSILATSREPLAVTGERVHPVAPLGLPGGAVADAASVRSAEAVQLFETRAASVRPEFAVTDQNAAAVAGVCRSLDGTPLAIELAAARLRVLTIEQIADRLDHQLELLSEESAAGSRGRRRTLRAAFDWSHNLLSDPERAVFARLSVFAGGFNLAAAEAIAADPPAADPPGARAGTAGGPVTGGQVLRLLETLTEKSLVVGETGAGAVAGEVRFRLLEATRQYACQRLADLGEADAVRRRHAQFFLELATRADADRRGPHRVELGRRLAAEYDNITTALLWARAAGEHDLSLQLSAAMGWYWARRPREGLSWVRAALAAGRSADPRHRQWALWAAAHLSAHAAPAEALQFSRRSVELAIEAGDARLAIQPLLIHGRLVEQRGEPERAARLHDQAVSYAEAAGDTAATAAALRSRGLTRAHAGDHANAELDITRAGALFARLGDRVGAVETQLNLARLALLRDQAPLTERIIRDLLPQLRALVPDEFDTATAHRYLAWIAARAHRWDAVDTELATSLQLAFRLNAARVVAFDLILAALAAHARGMPRRAAVILGAVDTHLHKRAAPLRKAERAERDNLEAALRDHLGEMRLLLLWERGAAVPIKTAVAFALDPAADIPDGDWDSPRLDAPLLPLSD
jgi:predicted ATPase